MKSFYSAYLAYERRVVRGEYTRATNKTQKMAGERESLLALLGEILIQTGMKLKQNHSIRKSISWSTLAGSKP